MSIFRILVHFMYIIPALFQNQCNIIYLMLRMQPITWQETAAESAVSQGYNIIVIWHWAKFIIDWLNK